MTEIKKTENIKEWKMGFKHGIPIFMGYFAVSFAFGIQAGKAGLSIWQTMLMTITNVTSAGQFSALTVIGAGASYFEMACTQLLINLRYMLMSFALSQKIDKRFPFFHRFFVACGVTDEIFGTSIYHGERLSPYYSYGLMSSSIPGWAFGTFAGIVSGNILPKQIISALGIILYGMFLAIIIPVGKEDRGVLWVILGSFLGATLFFYLPVFHYISAGFQIILVTVLMAGVGALVFPREEFEDEA
ncbi:MAG TPA: AzlC family ABC transporter permease [Lachnospiraceae bacterium]